MILQVLFVLKINQCSRKKTEIIIKNVIKEYLTFRCPLSQENNIFSFLLLLLLYYLCIIIPTSFFNNQHFTPLKTAE